MSVWNFLSHIGAGALNLLGTSSTNQENREIARETNELNYKMFKEQLGFTEDMWNKTNEYNSPSHQRELYEQAGINPYMALGNMPSGEASMTSTPSPSPAVTGAPMQAPNFDFVGDAVSSYQEGRMREKQIESLGIDNKLKAIDLSFRNAEKIASLEETRQRIATSKADEAVKNKSLLELDEQIESLKTQNRFLEPYLTERNNEARNAARLRNEEVELKKLEQDYQKMVTDMDKKLKQSQIGLNGAQARQANAMIGQIMETVNQMKLNGKSTRECQHYANEQVKAQLKKLGLEGKQLQNAVDSYIPWLDPWINRIGKVGGFVLGLGGLAYGRGLAGAAAGASSVPPMNIQRTNPTLYIP